MLVHRFRELLDSTPSVPTALSGHSAAFMPCPCPAALGMSAVQQAQAEYLYRLAYEQAQAQLADARSSAWPTFSLN